MEVVQASMVELIQAHQEMSAELERVTSLLIQQVNPAPQPVTVADLDQNRKVLPVLRIDGLQKGEPVPSTDLRPYSRVNLVREVGSLPCEGEISEFPYEYKGIQMESMTAGLHIVSEIYVSPVIPSKPTRFEIPEREMRAIRALSQRIKREKEEASSWDVVVIPRKRTKPKKGGSTLHLLLK